MDVEAGDVFPSSDVALTTAEKTRILSATRAAKSLTWDIALGHQFFLCDELEPTEFRKISPGGIQGHRYFDLEQVLGGMIPSDLPSLAKALKATTWE